MIFHAKWPIPPGISWQTAVTRLVGNLEKEGCVVAEQGARREICIPGLDERLMSQLKSMINGNSSSNHPHEGLLTEDWNHFVQRELWGRAEIRINAESRTVEYEWTYWTSFQIAFHLLLSVLFFAAGCRPEWGWLLFVPTGFALIDAYSFRQLISKWHIQCSPAPAVRGVSG